MEIWRYQSFPTLGTQLVSSPNTVPDTSGSGPEEHCLSGTFPEPRPWSQL